MLKTDEINIEYLQTLLNEIIKTHSFKQVHSPIVKTKLTKNEKIKFALDYYDTFGAISLLTILQKTASENRELKKLIVEFMARFNLLKPYPSSEFEYISKFSSLNIIDQRMRSLNAASITREYNYQNWLEPFDENTIFEVTKAKHPSIHVYLDNNGNPIKFDKERASKVKLAIVNEGIIPARCIVENGYPYEAKENLEEYINHLKTLRR